MSYMTRFIQQQRMKNQRVQTLKQVPEAPCPDCNKPAATGRTKRLKK